MSFTSPDPDERFIHPLRLKVVNLLAVVVPLAGLVLAIVLLWGGVFNWVYLLVLGLMYLITNVGIGVGFHRYFTHRSFHTPRPVAFILAAMGSMAVQGPLLKWVAVHRCHHHHSDDEADPHSPHAHGGSLVGVLRGAWHAHVGWLLTPISTELTRYVQDLRSDRLVCLSSRLFVAWVILGLLIPAALGGLLTWSWMGVLLGFIWGGLVRVCLGHHVTWSINSVCHLWGSKPFRSNDESRNNIVFGILAFGEGWHNGHHAFPSSARHGLRWWEIDFNYLIIRGLSLVRLARDIRVPSAARLAAKQRGADHDDSDSQGSGLDRDRAGSELRGAGA